MLVWRVFVVEFVVESLFLLCHLTVAQQHRIVYSRDQLIELKPAGLATVMEDISAELWRKTHRGCSYGRYGGGKERNTGDFWRGRHSSRVSHLSSWVT